MTEKVYPIMTLNTPNKNRCLYSTEVMTKAIEDFNRRGSVKPNYGCIYLDTFHLPDFTIPVEKISHEIANVRIKNDQVFATIKPLNTPEGVALQKLMDGDIVGFVPTGIFHQKKEQKIGDETITVIQDFTILSILATSRYQAP